MKGNVKATVRDRRNREVLNTLLDYFEGTLLDREARRGNIVVACYALTGYRKPEPGRVYRATFHHLYMTGNKWTRHTEDEQDEIVLRAGRLN